MLWLTGAVIVILSVLLGYVAEGGVLRVIWQPFEFLIIIGASIGALITSSTRYLLGEMATSFKSLLSGPRYDKESYTQLLSILYLMFKLARTKGNVALEAHIENPDNSSILGQFPKFLADERAATFLCDYLRMLTMGTENPNELESLFDEELATLHAQVMRVPSLLQNTSDGIPALGIVAAVLGVIQTMASISQPPEVLGHLIGAALVGTFLGVLLAYGFVGPVASGMRAINTTDMKYFESMKAGILAHLHGQPPSIAVEFARKTIFSEVRPTFYELEQTVSKLTIE